MNKLIIDRIEGKYAICEQEDKTLIKLPKYKLPPGSKEGGCIVLNKDGIYQTNLYESQERESRIRDKINRLFQS